MVSNVDGSTLPGMRERLMAGLVAIIGAAWHFWQGRSVWLSADFWGLLLNHDLTPAGLLTPHAGHLAVFHVLSAQVGYALFGLESGGWFFGVRSVAWAAVSVWIWWLVRRSGGGSWQAMALLWILSFYGLAGWLMGWLIGNPLAIGFGVTAAFHVDRNRNPGRRDVVLLAVLLTAGAAATSLGVAALGAVGLSLALLRHRGAYWSSWSIALFAYGVWFVTMRDGSGPGLALSVSDVLRLPLTYLEIVAGGLDTILPGRLVVGWVGAILLVGRLGLSWIRGRLPRAAIILILWSAVFVGLVSVTRIAAGQADTATARYAYLVVLLLLVALAAASRDPAPAAAKVSLVAVTAAVLWSSVSFLQVGIRFWDERSNASRIVVSTAAALIADGEPYFESALVDEPRAGMLTARGLQRMVDEGWAPTPASEAIPEARGELVLDVLPGQASGDCASFAGPTAVRLPPSRVFTVDAGTSPVRIEYSGPDGPAVATVDPGLIRTIRVGGTTVEEVTVIAEDVGLVCTP